ncbi:MAG: TadE/TadG family type IV pilus assembly protein [Rhizobiaceae bacterium]
MHAYRQGAAQRSGRNYPADFTVELEGKAMWKRIAETICEKKFYCNQRGGVKILTAISLPFVMLIAGGGFDVAELYRARINLQSAVDAGTLMAAKKLASTGNAVVASAAGRELFLSNIRNVIPDIKDASIEFTLNAGECAQKPIVGNGTIRKQVFFAFMRAATTEVVGIIDGTKQATEDERMVSMSSSSEVLCGGDTLEIALVLDNSGSMESDGKINTLRIAAEDLVTTLHDSMGGLTKPNPLQFSIVPFAGMVNVGSGNRNESWMDTTGVGTHHHEYLNWDADPQAIKIGNRYQTVAGEPLTRFTLFDNLPGVDWRGCVESRPYPELTLDTEPDLAVPATMFVPTFAPDTPDNWTGEMEQQETVTPREAICSVFKRNRPNKACRTWSDGHSGRNHPQDPSYRPTWDDGVEYSEGEFIGDEDHVIVVESGGAIVERNYHNNYLKDDHNFALPQGHPKSPSYTGTGADQHQRQNWTWKYFNNPNPYDVNNDLSNLPSISGIEGGPNAYCTAQETTELTPNQANVLDDIASMQAFGTTHIQAGIAWGWRTLSAGEPFTQGRGYSVADNKKIMIVMTDGENTAYPIEGSDYSTLNKAHYNTWGHSENMRIFDGVGGIFGPSPDSRVDLESAMNAHMASTCENAKSVGISIYTIAFDVADGSPVKALMEDCASFDSGGSKQYFDAENNAELLATFQQIATQLADLSIVK